MGPNRAALLRLSSADKLLREAISDLEAVTKGVRAQEHKCEQLRARLTAAENRQRELSAKSANFDLEMKAREAHIEKLRVRQQMATNNKEYQALLVEINTGKVDRAKIEEQAIKVLEQLESVSSDVTSMSAAMAAEDAKLVDLRASIGEKASDAQKLVDQRRPEREQAASAITPAALEMYERMSGRYEGDAIAAISKPNAREEDYLCTGCQMSLVADMFNKLKGKDEFVPCPSCRRLLYIPDDMVLSTSSDAKKATRAKAPKSDKAPRERKTTVKVSAEVATPAQEKWGTLVRAAQGESVRDAKDADHKPIECLVTVNGERIGVFKGKSAEHLERVIRFRLDEQNMSVELKVVPHETRTDAPASAVSSDQHLPHDAQPMNSAQPTGDEMPKSDSMPAGV
jgi:uncharacterized protein